jgi:biopolymer transport protein ExbD
MAVKLLLALLCIVLSACNEPKTYASACSTLRQNWRTAEQDWHHAIFNTVKLEKAGTLRWNGVQIDEARLTQYFQAVNTLNPVPTVVLKVDPDADCAAVERIRDQLEEQMQCKASGRCGEGDGVWGDGGMFG